MTDLTNQVALVTGAGDGIGKEVIAAGVRVLEALAQHDTGFRLEFVHESAAELRGVTRLFADALAGKINAAQLNRELKTILAGGTTQGSLFVPPGYLTLPILQ